MEIVSVPPPPPPRWTNRMSRSLNPNQNHLKWNPLPNSLDISQLEVMLNPGFGDFMGGDFGVQLKTALTNNEEMDEIFSSSELDRRLGG